MSSIHPTAHVPESARIGEGCTIEAGVILGERVELEAHVSVGIGAIISDQIFIGHHSVIAPGAVVTMNVPENVVMSGNPAKCTGTAESHRKREIKYAIPDQAKFTYCRSDECNRTIYWIVTPAGKRMPVDPDGTPHFATCPAAQKFRRRS